MFNRRRFLEGASALLPLGGAVGAVGMVGCSSPAGARPPFEGITASDYSRPEHWLSVPTRADKPVDVFYLYSTAWRKLSPAEPDLCAIDNPTMLVGARFAYARQATAFETVANVFAPYYRQADAAYTLGLPPLERDRFIAREPTIDALAAFEHFIRFQNQGRPFILAGHSQGSNVLLNLLSDYMVRRPDVYRRMVAAYVIGYSVTTDYLARNPHLRFAQGPDDTGVIVSYNTQSPEVAEGKNPVVLPGSLVINPLTWTRSNALAGRSLNLGSWMAVSTTSFEHVPELADAQVDAARGVLLTTVDSTALRLGLGPGIFHSYDYSFYYFNLRENAARRIANFHRNDAG